MVIKTNDIKKLFSLISEKKISREKAQEKAIEIRESYDNGKGHNTKSEKSVLINFAR